MSAGMAVASALPTWPSAATAFLRAFASGCFNSSTQCQTGLPWTVSGSIFPAQPARKTTMNARSVRCRTIHPTPLSHSMFWITSPPERVPIAQKA